MNHHSANVPKANGRKIWLAGGCFWGTEAYLESIPGVLQTEVGYANGRTEHPTYEQVCSGTTGFAETVAVAYDPGEISLSFLLDLYYQSIDPISINRQGGDVGEQYRTGIYYEHAEDFAVISKSIAKLAQSLAKPVAIEVLPLENYYPAEDYHQKYLQKNPNGYCHLPQSLIDYGKYAKLYAKPSDQELRSALLPLEYEVTQHSATEPPYQNRYDQEFREGIYVDITTGEPLFLSTAKYRSGCGWPAFAQPINPHLLKEIPDTSHRMLRTEVRSFAGDAHLGHVFEDGPEELGGRHYCINSAALKFIPIEEMVFAGYQDYLPLLEQEKTNVD